MADSTVESGLGRLRWYCQICEKQCRDENGFQVGDIVFFKFLVPTSLPVELDRLLMFCENYAFIGPLEGRTPSTQIDDSRSQSGSNNRRILLPISIGIHDPPSNST